MTAKDISKACVICIFLLYPLIGLIEMILWPIIGTIITGYVIYDEFIRK